MISERLQQLLEYARTEAASFGRRRTNFEEQCAFARLAVMAARECKGQSPLVAITRQMELFANDFPITILPDEHLFGSQRFMFPSQAAWNTAVSDEELHQLSIYEHHGHIIPDFPRLLREGIDGTLERINAMPEGEVKTCFSRVMKAFAHFISRYAEYPQASWVAPLAHREAQNWREALQLLWFAVVFIHAEGNCAAVSLGRFDDYMMPYYDAGSPDADDYLGEFLLKFTQGEESQNMTLTGTGSNPLFFSILRLVGTMKLWQPSISVIVSEAWNDSHFLAAAELTAAGLGMPSYFGDATIKHALANLGDTAEAIDQWGVVGCYEAAPSGKCYALTVGYQGAMNHWFADFFQSTASEQPNFDAFLAAWDNWLANIAETTVFPELERRRKWFADNLSSAFLSVLIDGCIEHALPLEAGGAEINHFGLNIMGLGSVVDSLLAVKTLVFEKHAISLNEFKYAVLKNFPDETFREQCRNLPGKYGTDSLDSNLIAKHVSTVAGKLLNGKCLPGNPRMVTSLGLFWFGGDINVSTPATPDGRCGGDVVSYGVGPGYFLKNYVPTAILNAATHVCNDCCPNGNPLQLTLNRSLLSKDKGRQMLASLVKSFFERGGFHLQFNLADAEIMADAQQHPERHSDLIVRVSGFSAPFNSVEKHWQDVLIERAKRGL